MSALQSLIVPILVWTTVLTAQPCLVLSQPAIAGDGTVTMNLSLYATPEKAPSAVEWTLSSPNLTSFRADDGPVLSAAGKSAFCAGKAHAYRCIIAGVNTKRILNGIIARITAVSEPGASAPVIALSDLLAVSPAGYVIPVVSRIMPPGGANFTSNCRLHPLPRGSAKPGAHAAFQP